MDLAPIELWEKIAFEEAKRLMLKAFIAIKLKLSLGFAL